MCVVWKEGEGCFQSSLLTFRIRRGGKRVRKGGWGGSGYRGEVVCVVVWEGAGWVWGAQGERERLCVAVHPRSPRFESSLLSSYFHRSGKRAVA